MRLYYAAHDGKPDTQPADLACHVIGDLIKTAKNEALLLDRNAIPGISKDEYGLFRLVPGQNFDRAALTVKVDGVKHQPGENRFHKFRVSEQKPLFSFQIDLDPQFPLLAKIRP